MGVRWGQAWTVRQVFRGWRCNLLNLSQVRAVLPHTILRLAENTWNPPCLYPSVFDAMVWTLIPTSDAISGTVMHHTPGHSRWLPTLIFHFITIILKLLSPIQLSFTQTISSPNPSFDFSPSMGRKQIMYFLPIYSYTKRRTWVCMAIPSPFYQLNNISVYWWYRHLPVTQISYFQSAFLHIAPPQKPNSAICLDAISTL